MREIKFRAWIDFEPEYKPQMINHVFAIEFDIDTYVTWVDGGKKHTAPISNGCLMQYTGLKDKNEKEIYEGDIVEHYGLLCTVVFANGAFCLSNESGLSYIWKSEDNKIIGNIHENPELL